MKILIGIYRVFITALFFSAFGIGALFISVVIFSLISLFVKDKIKRTDLSRNITQKSFSIFLKSGVILQIFKININGTEKLKNDRGIIYIANHPSLIDVVIIGSVVPNTCAVVKNALTHNPFLKGIVNCNRYVPNQGEAKDIVDNCAHELSLGSNLIIFPEGTRSLDLKKFHFTHGFSSIALRGPFKVRPIVINFKGYGLRKNVPWYHMYYSKAQYDIYIEDVFDTNEFIKAHQDKERSALSRHMAKELENYILANLK